MYLFMFKQKRSMVFVNISKLVFVFNRLAAPRDHKHNMHFGVREGILPKVTLRFSSLKKYIVGLYKTNTYCCFEKNLRNVF